MVREHYRQYMCIHHPNMPQTCEKRRGTYSLHVDEAHVCNKIFSHTTHAAESKHFMHGTLFTPKNICTHAVLLT